jgi:hypothetical protein
MGALGRFHECHRNAARDAGLFGSTTGAEFRFLLGFRFRQETSMSGARLNARAIDTDLLS